MIGVSSYVYHNQPLSEALENLENITNCAEIYSEGLHDLLKDSETPLSYNLNYAIHAPNTDLNIGSIREPMRKAGIDIINQMVDICDQINAKVLVVHPGYFSFSCDVPDARDSLMHSISEIENINDDNEVEICIENMPSDWDCFLFQNPDIDLMDNGFALDVGHANTTGMLDEFLKHDISHFHIHDNNGDKDEHLWIGGGNIDFENMSHVLNERNTMKILEHGKAEYVETSINALKKMDIK